MENNQEKSRFVTNVNINAPIHNYYAHIEKMYTGSQPKSDSMKELKDQVTDERISRAIMSITGDNKPLNEKQLFIGVICVLMSKYGWSVGYQPTLSTEMGELQERITTTKKGSITSVQAIYVPADDLTDPAPATAFAHLDATTVLSRQIAELGIYPAVDFLPLRWGNIATRTLSPCKA